MSDKQVHLQMVQAVITRMASNSFLLKGWSVTLVSSLFVLSGVSSAPGYAMVSVLPVVAFWALDAFFLRQEHLFRGLYNAVASKPEAQVDFSMNTSSVASSVASWHEVAVSSTLLWFHGILLTTVVVIATALVLAG